MLFVITFNNNIEIIMELKEYLQTHNLTVYLFANICRLSIPVIYRILNSNNISPRSAKRIYNVTQGKVDYKNIQTFHGVTCDDENN